MRERGKWTYQSLQLQAKERLHLCRVYVNILTWTTQPLQCTDSYYAVWHLRNAFVQCTPTVLWQKRASALVVPMLYPLFLVMLMFNFTHFYLVILQQVLVRYILYVPHQNTNQLCYFPSCPSGLLNSHAISCDFNSWFQGTACQLASRWVIMCCWVCLI